MGGSHLGRVVGRDSPGWGGVGRSSLCGLVCVCGTPLPWTELSGCTLLGRVYTGRDSLGGAPLGGVVWAGLPWAGLPWAGWCGWGSLALHRVIWVYSPGRSVPGARCRDGADDPAAPPGAGARGPLQRRLKRRANLQTHTFRQHEQ